MDMMCKGWIWGEDQNPSYCVFYAMNENGEKDFYRYDLTEKTLQRYFRDPASGTASDGQGATVDEYNSLLKDYNMRFLDHYWSHCAVGDPLDRHHCAGSDQRDQKMISMRRRDDGDDYPHKAAKEKREKPSRRLSREEKYLADLEEEEDEYQGDELNHMMNPAVETDQQAYRRPRGKTGTPAASSGPEPSENDDAASTEYKDKNVRYPHHRILCLIPGIMEPVKRTQKPAPAPAAKPENQDDDLEFVDLDL